MERYDRPQSSHNSFTDSNTLATCMAGHSGHSFWQSLKGNPIVFPSWLAVDIATKRGEKNLSASLATERFHTRLPGPAKNYKATWNSHTRSVCEVQAGIMIRDRIAKSLFTNTFISAPPEKSRLRITSEYEALNITKCWLRIKKLKQRN